jgi:hypothetical protein
MKFRHTTLLAISAAIWLAVGMSLLSVGLRLLVSSGQGHTDSIVNFLSKYTGGAEYASIVLIAVSLFIGHMKGKHVLSKTVARCVARIQTFPNPTNLSNMYGRGYYILLLGMIGLGMSLRWLGISDGLRGIIDTAVGAALIQGAVVYLRNIQHLRKASVS